MSTILFADKVHLNEKNFESFLATLKEKKLTIESPDFPKSWITCFGDYAEAPDGLAVKLVPFIDEAQQMLTSAVASYQYLEVDVFTVCRAEILTLALAQPYWAERVLPTGEQTLLQALWDWAPDVVTKNFAVAMYWIVFWRKTVKATARLTHVAVFSGSLIYARALLEVMKGKPGKVFVLESLFTGNDYYCEERYLPISNHSDIMLPTVFQSVALPEEQHLYERERNKALNKILSMKNKNVVQPESVGGRFFEEGNPVVLVLGQVVNDFSVIEYKWLGLNTLPLYCRIIENLLHNTESNVVFKAHPWENQKANLNGPVTKMVLEARFADTISKGRLKIVENYNLYDLFAEADYVVTINSQSGIEAAMHGFKPIQLGEAFWGRKGFSYDLDPCEGPKDLTSIISCQSGRLSFDEYRHFEEYITKLFQFWSVSVFQSGIGRLRQIFAEHQHLKLVSPGQTKAVQKTSVKPNAETKQTQDNLLVGCQQVPSFLCVPTTVQTPGGSFSRKLRKLKRDPYAYFRDAGFTRIASLFKGK
ncbi:MAG: hypothetical protein AB7U43_03050 [Desulfobacter sp.]